MVPPLGRMPRQRSTSSGRVRFSVRPFQPSRNPTKVSACSTSPLRTTALITALSPGQSPPPVSTPTRITTPRFDGAATLTRSGLPLGRVDDTPAVLVLELVGSDRGGDVRAGVVEALGDDVHRLLVVPGPWSGGLLAVQPRR